MLKKSIAIASLFFLIAVSCNDDSSQGGGPNPSPLSGPTPVMDILPSTSLQLFAEINSSVSQVFNLKLDNAGGNTIIVNTTELTSSGVFHLASGTCGTATNCNITVAFEPSVAGTFTVNLPIYLSSQPSTPIKTITIKGNALTDIQPNPYRSKTLVIYNTNADDAQEIAEYYANRRGISANQLCPVKAPQGMFATKNEFYGIRRTIIRNCLCPLIPAGQRPSPCDEDHTSALAAVSQITHLAIIKGLPSRIYNTGGPQEAFGKPSLDFMLSRLIYQPLAGVFEPFANEKPGNGVAQINNTQLCLNDNHLNPAVNFAAALGRIEAMDRDATINLIDRTIAAEYEGLRGNLIASTYNSYTQETMLDFTNSRAPACYSYIAPRNEWPAAQCRTGIEPVGLTPGYLTNEVLVGLKSSIPYAMDVGLYYGLEYGPANHAAFEGDFNRLLRWRKNSKTCTALCSELPTQSEIDSCRAHSTDYFKELNTDCVGANPGLIGHKKRSFPVQYYGFFPQGWMPYEGGVEKMPPQLMQTGGYTNTRFLDQKFIRFGSTDETKECTDSSGSLASCIEHLAIDMRRKVDVDHTGLTERTYLLGFHYRNSASALGKLHAILNFYDSTGALIPALKADKVISLATAHENWAVASTFTSLGESDLQNVKKVEVLFSSTLNDQATGFLDLDGIELITFSTDGIETQLIPTDIGSFSAPYVNNLAHGDWASNMIDRMGAIAWWGSTSHYIQGGHAFEDSTCFHRTFTSDRSLGEAILASGTGGDYAGAIYGDPMYTPSTAALRFSNGNYPSDITFTAHNYNKLPSDLMFSAKHGHSKSSKTHWRVDKCVTAGDSKTDCVVDSDYSLLKEGQGWVQNEWLGLNSMMDLVDNQTVTQNIVVRLKVWNDGEENQALYSFGKLQFKVLSANAPAVPGDFNDDGCVDGADFTVFFDNMYQTVTPYNLGDANGDGYVDGSDYTIIADNYLTTCAGN